MGGKQRTRILAKVGVECGCLQIFIGKYIAIFEQILRNPLLSPEGGIYIKNSDFVNWIFAQILGAQMGL